MSYHKIPIVSFLILLVSIIFSHSALASNVSIDGAVSYDISGSQITVNVDRITNNESGGNSGSLKIKLWASTSTYSGTGGCCTGYVIADFSINNGDVLDGGSFYFDIKRTLSYSPPPDDTYSVVMVLLEYNGSDYVIRDYRNFSNPFVVGNSGTLPNSPTGLTITSPTSSSLLLNWTDNSSIEVGYKIYRSTSTTSGFTQIETVGSNVTSYIASNLSSSATYYFKVRAYNSLGSSDSYSNTASGTTTSSSSSTPNSPTGLTIISPTSSSLLLNWRDNNGIEVGYMIYQSRSATSGFTLIGTVLSKVTSYTASNLSSSTTYYFKVRAYNGSVNSLSYSNTVSGITASEGGSGGGGGGGAQSLLMLLFVVVATLILRQLPNSRIRQHKRRRNYF